MKLPYARMVGTRDDGSPHVDHLPLLDVRNSGPRGACTILMLVDSGSTETLLPADVAALLDIKFSGERMNLSGLGGSEVDARITESVEFEFAPGWSTSSEVVQSSTTGSALSSRCSATSRSSSRGSSASTRETRSCT